MLLQASTFVRHAALCCRDLAVHDSDEDEPLTGRAAAKPQQGTLDAFFKKSGSSQIGSQQAAKPSKGKTGVAAKSKAGAKLTSGGGIALKRQVAAAAAPESGTPQTAPGHMQLCCSALGQLRCTLSPGSHRGWLLVPACRRCG